MVGIVLICIFTVQTLKRNDMKNGTPDIMDIALNVRRHYKTIEEALKVERPKDIVVKILSNKFAIVKAAYENGKFDEDLKIMGIDGGTTVYSFCSLVDAKERAREIEDKPNVYGKSICYDFPANKKYAIWLYKHIDRRKYKQSFRKISRLI